MARGPTQRELYDELERRYGKDIAAAFERVVGDLRAAVEIQRAAQAVRDNDLTGLITSLHLDRAAYGPVLDQISNAYRDAGDAVARTLPAKDEQGGKLFFRFDIRVPSAEEYLRAHSAQLVTRIDADQREAIRAALAAGLQRGENPMTTALDIVGRIDKETGERRGGIVGLTSQQAQHVENARQELLSGDPALMRNYLTREARNRKFDGRVLKAIEAEQPLDGEIRVRALTAYQNRLLKVRGDNIARTETMTALHAAKHESFRQLVDSGKVKDSSVLRKWRSAGDMHVRHTHMVLNGNTMKGLDRPFVSPSGARMRFPGDIALGASASEICGCRCDCDYKIDFLADLRPPPAPPKEPDVIQAIPPHQFKATDYAQRFDDPEITPAKVLSNFEPKVAAQIRAAEERLQTVTPTAHLYRRPDGTYDEARAALHRQILFEGQEMELFDEKTGELAMKKVPPIFSREAVEAATPLPGQDPLYVMLGGRGGSGKSGLAGPAYDPNHAVVLDSDAIKVRLPEYRGWNAAQVHEEAGDVFDAATAYAKQMGLNLVHDATLKNPKKAVRLAQEFKDEGYQLALRYVFVPRQESAKRAISRSQRSKRLVPPEVILQNTTNEQSFEAIREMADSWQFWDNQTTLTLVAQGRKGE